MPDFYVFSNSPKTATLPIKYSGQGGLETLKLAINWLKE